jgi:hypothetical protein
MARQITNTARPRFAGRTIVHPIHPHGTVGTSFLFCVSARFLEPASTSENLRCCNPTSAKVCRDRVGNYSDRQTAAPTGSALLTRSSRSSSVACATLLETTHCMQAAARRTSVQRDNFRDALLPLATAARIYRSRGGGRGGNDKRSWLLLFNSVRANVSTTYRISFACTQGRIETE